MIPLKLTSYSRHWKVWGFITAPIKGVHRRTLPKLQGEERTTRIVPVVALRGEIRRPVSLSTDPRDAQITEMGLMVMQHPSREEIDVRFWYIEEEE